MKKQQAKENRGQSNHTRGPAYPGGPMRTEAQARRQRRYNTRKLYEVGDVQLFGAWQPLAEPEALYFPAHYAAGFYCQFAHGVDELRSPPATLASPERVPSASCSARRFKTRLCKYFLAGHCPYAATNTCQFAHSNDELRAPLDGGNGAGPGVSD